ncbi:MAG: efflux RND transporter periplasmic adaptor subunit [Pontibacterium sp.]
MDRRQSSALVVFKNIKRMVVMASVALFSVPSLASIESAQLNCLLEPSQQIAITSQVPGVVKRVNGERGALVKKGQTLLELENAVEKALVQTAKIRVDFAKRKLERNKELIKKGLLSDLETDELNTELKLASAALAEARARLAQRKTASPVSGYVSQRNISVGEFAGTEPVMELVSLHPLYAEVVLRSSHYGKVAVGAEIPMEVMGPAGGKVTGKVTVIDRVIDAASGTFGIRVEIDNSDLSMPAGLPCRIVSTEGQQI